MRWFDRAEDQGRRLAKAAQSARSRFGGCSSRLFLGAVIIVGRIVADTFGEAGLLPFAATAGLADVDAVTLAAGSLVRGGLEPRSAHTR